MVHSPDILMDFAMEAYLNGDLNKALDNLKEAIMKNPEYVLCYHLQYIMEEDSQSGGGDSVVKDEADAAKGDAAKAAADAAKAAAEAAEVDAAKIDAAAAAEAAEAEVDAAKIDAVAAAKVAAKAPEKAERPNEATTDSRELDNAIARISSELENKLPKSSKKFLANRGIKLKDMDGNNLREVLNDDMVSAFLTNAGVNKKDILSAIETGDVSNIDNLLGDMNSSIDGYKKKQSNAHSSGMEMMSNERAKKKATFMKGGIIIGGVVFIMVTLTLLSAMLGGGKGVRRRSKTRRKSKRRKKSKTRRKSKRGRKSKTRRKSKRQMN